MRKDDGKAKHTELTARILKVFFSVYNELGFGFIESVYERAMEIALTQEGLRVERQLALTVWFRGQQVGDFRADTVVDGAVLLEIKAARRLDSSHEAQTLNYLRATDIEVALLLNFGPKPEFRRLVFDNERKKGRGKS